MKNISKEDYLSTIYRHRNNEGGIKATQLAEQLEISNAAVTDMMKKLSRDGLVNYTRYKGIKLTGRGESYARNMVRRHRIWELFLQRIVGMPWDKVHDEAENLEHSSSDELINRLEEMLDYPHFDPHGDPIPDKDGVIVIRHDKTLDQVKQGDSAIIVGVKDHSTAFLKFVDSISLTLGTEVKVLEVINYDKSLVIKTENYPSRSLSYQVCKNLLVE